MLHRIPIASGPAPDPVEDGTSGSAAPLVVESLSGRTGHTFDFCIAAASCVTIAGPSGIGKSMLLRMIADLDPHTGSVRIGARARDAMPAPDWRRQVVYVASESGWWTSPVSAHFADPAAVDDRLGELGLDRELLNAVPSQLSTGERQRLALLRAIELRPRFLLLDEPTSSLDIAATLKVEALLGRIRSGGAGLLVVSHDEAQIARIADRQLRLTASGLMETA